jgi:hypothetical protein
VLNLLVVSVSSLRIGQLREVPGTADTSQVWCHSELLTQAHECILTGAAELDRHICKTGNKDQRQKLSSTDGMEDGPR